jgi:ABC-type nitrate/sulfonate/bicarbonate transport system substrate-binding protein
MSEILHARQLWVALGRRARLLGAAVLGSAMMLGLQAAAQDKPLTPIVWGVDSFLTTLPQRIAEDKGFFKEEGVAITLRVSALGVESMDQIIAGEADLGNGAHWALVNRMARPNIGIGGFILAWRVPVCLMASSQVKTLADLKGHKIAVIAGSVWDWYLDRALAKAGLATKDVEVTNFGSPVDYLAAAARGDIDAGWFWESNYARAKEVLGQQGWTCLATRADVAPQSAIDGHGPLPISLKSVAEKPEAIAGALRAYKRAGDWCHANIDECATLANKLIGAPVEEAKKLIPDLGWYVGTSDEFIPMLKDMKDFALARGIIKKENDYDLATKIVFGPAKQAFPNGTGELPK